MLCQTCDKPVPRTQDGYSEGACKKCVDTLWLHEQHNHGYTGDKESILKQKVNETQRLYYQKHGEEIRQKQRIRSKLKRNPC